MYLTEEEARKKWCPHSRIINTKDGQVSASHNRVWVEGESQGEGKLHIQMGSAFCIASECMMWRWRSYRVDFSGTDMKTENVAENGTLGYCGLAGKP